MNAERDYTDALADIEDAMIKAQSFVAGMTYEQFVQDGKTVYAVIRALEIIGEAAKQIPDSMRESHSDIPWREMAGMRDKLIHHYFGIVHKTIWLTVTEDISSLLPKIRSLNS